MEKEKQFIKKELPIGTGRESEPKETLSAIEVANEVIWINPNFDEMPFNLKEGEPTRLGMFLTPKPKKEKITDLKVDLKHNRSALLGRAIFRDGQNRLYRDIDLKGMGYSGIDNGSIKTKSVSKFEDKDEARGILSLDWAEHARDMSERFLEKGIRTERYIALIKLDEIINKHGEKISIEKAKRRKLIYKTQEPTVAIRAMGTKFRIDDVKAYHYIHPNERVRIIEDAKKIVAQEFGFKDGEFFLEDYFRWFAETAGKNLGLMHRNNWCHKFLSDHNVTLDCRFVDLDSVSNTNKQSDFKRDYDSLEESCIRLFCGDYNKDYSTDGDYYPRKFLKIFTDSYIKVLGYTPEFLAKEEK